MDSETRTKLLVIKERIAQSLRDIEDMLVDVDGNRVRTGEAMAFEDCYGFLVKASYAVIIAEKEEAFSKYLTF